MRVPDPRLPSADGEADRVVLRDGSIVHLRLATPADRGSLAGFFHGLSFDSLRRRFFVAAEPSAALIDTFCGAAGPRTSATLLALRTIDGATKPVAVGSYFRIDSSTAEVAFAVDDHLHGLGLATVLLHRLAALAAAHGFTRFDAVTLPDNAAMLEVFRESGFEMRVHAGRGVMSVELSLDPTHYALPASA